MLGCVAQQEGEKIFERAPYVSLVCGSASYRNLPEMLVQIEAGEDRITGLDDRQTDETFETEFTARTNPHRGYITIIEGCDKFCAYCVVPYTRGKERSRTSESVLAEARQMADLGYTEIQLLGQNVNSYKDPAEAKTSPNCWPPWAKFPESAACASPLRIRATSPATSSRPSTPCPRSAITCILPVQSGSTRVLDAMQRLYTREQYLERIAWMKSAKRDISITTDIIVGFPGETEQDFEETLSLLDEVPVTTRCSRSSIRRVRTRRRCSMEDAISDAEKARRLTVLQEHQREIQSTSNQRHIGASP